MIPLSVPRQTPTTKPTHSLPPLPQPTYPSPSDHEPHTLLHLTKIPMVFYTCQHPFSLRSHTLATSPASSQTHYNNFLSILTKQHYPIQSTYPQPYTTIASSALTHNNILLVHIKNTLTLLSLRFSFSPNVKIAPRTLWTTTTFSASGRSHWITQLKALMNRAPPPPRIITAKDLHFNLVSPPLINS